MLKRSGFKRLTYSEARARTKQVTFAEALAKALEKRNREAEKPATGRPRLKLGPRMRRWASVWKWLKPRLEAAGRTRCEFDHVPHQCGGPLTPAHSKKRRKIVGDEIYAVAICCTSGHQVLDEKLTHEQMYVAVMYAINRAGGLITPALEAARKETKAA